MGGNTIGASSATRRMLHLLFDHSHHHYAVLSVLPLHVRNQPVDCAVSAAVPVHSAVLLSVRGLDHEVWTMRSGP
eukprot:scaffold7339_cov249-Pinguiococcus_pyrenoidosus.AAC.2